MARKPKTYTAFARIADKISDLVIRPSRPEAFDDVIFKAKLTGPPREILHVFEGIRAAVQIFPNGPSRLDPFSREALGEIFWTRRRANVRDEIGAHRVV